MKSTTCKGQNGQFLEEYHNQSTAVLAAEEINIRYGHDLVPTQCRGMRVLASCSFTFKDAVLSLYR